MIAFTGTMTATSTTLQNIAGVNDPTLRVSGNFIYIPSLSNLVSEYVVGYQITGAQLQAPSLKKFVNYDLATFDSASSSGYPTAPTPFTAHYGEPYLLQPNEGLQALIVQAGSTSNQNSVIVELSDGVVAPVSPAGNLTVKATFTVPSGNFTWNNASLTFSQTLPVGNYNCIGARVELTRGIALRFFPVGGIYRPGVTIRQNVYDPDVQYERRGGKGILFAFNQLTPPSVDVFHNGASGTGTVYLDLIPGQ